MTKNPIIEARLNQLTTKKTALLKLKKSERGNQLKSINQMINRLKSWMADPKTMIAHPEMEQRIKTNIDWIEESKRIWKDIFGHQRMENPKRGNGKNSSFHSKHVEKMIMMDDVLESHHKIISHDLQRRNDSVDAIEFWQKITQKSTGFHVDFSDSESKSLQLVPNELRNRIGSWEQAFEKRN